MRFRPVLPVHTIGRGAKGPKLPGEGFMVRATVSVSLGLLAVVRRRAGIVPRFGMEAVQRGAPDSADFEEVAGALDCDTLAGADVRGEPTAGQPVRALSQDGAMASSRRSPGGGERSAQGVAPMATGMSGGASRRPVRRCRPATGFLPGIPPGSDGSRSSPIRHPRLPESLAMDGDRYGAD